MIFHPVTTEISTLEDQIKEIVTACIESKINYIVIYPNNDNGSDIITKEYQRLKNKKHFKIYSSLRFEYFLTLLCHANFVIGNSSVGVREAEIYGVPSINIGTRQKNRNKNKSISNLNSNKKDILKAISKIKNKKFAPVNTFGDGKSSERFYNIISNKKIWNTTTQKFFRVRKLLTKP